MRRSTEIRLLAVALAGGLAANAAHARAVTPFAPHMMMPHPAFTMPLVRHPVGPRPLDPRIPGLRIGRTIGTPGRRPGHRFFGGGLGYDGYAGYDGLGDGGLGDGGFPQPAATDADVPPPYAIPAPPPPCLPPQIIKIDGGLAHPAKTRVVYGAPACGGY